MITSRVAALAAVAALAVALPLAAPAPATASKLIPVRTAYPVRHQFRQVLLRTRVRNQYRIGLWILNPVEGKIRLCLLGSTADTSNTMKCSAWVGGGGTAGQYYMMNMSVPTFSASGISGGLWIVNYQTGAVRACVVTDVDAPTGSVKCSNTQ